MKSRQNTPAMIVQVSFPIFKYTNVGVSEFVAKLNIGDRIAILERSFDTIFCLSQTFFVYTGGIVRAKKLCLKIFVLSGIFALCVKKLGE